MLCASQLPGSLRTSTVACPMPGAASLVTVRQPRRSYSHTREYLRTLCAGPAASKAQGKGRKGPSRTDYIERPRATGASPLDAIQLQPGVSIKGPEGARTGPQQTTDPANMTRAEFVAYAKKKNRALNAASAMHAASNSCPPRDEAGKSTGSVVRGAAGAQKDDGVVPAGKAAGGAGAAPAGEAVAPAAGGTLQERNRDAEKAAGGGAGGGSSAGAAAAARSAGGGSDAGRRGAGGRGQGPGSVKAPAPGGAGPPRGARETGLKGPLRRRTEDLPAWIQQGTLKPRSAAQKGRKAAGDAGAPRPLPPIASPATAGGSSPAMGMPVTKPTRESIANTSAHLPPVAAAWSAVYVLARVSCGSACIPVFVAVQKIRASAGACWRDHGSSSC